MRLLDKPAAFSILKMNGENEYDNHSEKESCIGS
ncbi:hypothetical protein BASP5262_07425 [Bacillus spizizenii]|nr:hypothetical protein DJ97_2806 [Bacillus spizizenii]SPT95838.1 Uncharacterised protein [Bacillus spizizenii]